MICIYLRTLATYMQALQVVPQLAEELEGELTFSLKAYGEHLAEIEQPSNALWLYSQVCVNDDMIRLYFVSYFERKSEIHAERARALFHRVSKGDHAWFSFLCVEQVGVLIPWSDCMEFSLQGIYARHATPESRLDSKVVFFGVTL